MDRLQLTAHLVMRADRDRTNLPVTFPPGPRLAIRHRDMGPPVPLLLAMERQVMAPQAMDLRAMAHLRVMAPRVPALPATALQVTALQVMLLAVMGAAADHRRAMDNPLSRREAPDAR